MTRMMKDATRPTLAGTTLAITLTLGAGSLFAAPTRGGSAASGANAVPTQRAAAMNRAATGRWQQFALLMRAFTSLRNQTEQPIGGGTRLESDNDRRGNDTIGQTSGGSQNQNVTMNPNP